MQPRAVQQLEVSVQVEVRDDGGLTITSQDVPGILLSSSDAPKIWALVGPVLKHLLEANHGYSVERVLYPGSYPTGPGSHDVPVRVDPFVAVLAAA